ncbi:MAG: hypothetical protein HYV26_23655 [Candidatus Hydrogenedentes bacterium]|nr:hypothetical protein [Candidatus Hydrogenedentota bacterium]MBI3117506.1 hypothetical protein [Candidatus Hydrogenedentota bacterium]
MLEKTDRRTFVKTALAAPAAMALSMQVGAEAQATPAAPAAASGALPQGRIGNLQVSRLLLGGNLLTHFTHSRDLKYVYNLAAHYNTDEKILETMAVAEQNGVNTLVIHTVPQVLNTLRKYRFEMGGKIQRIICPTAPVGNDLSEYAKQVQSLVDDEVEAVYLWGVHADKLAAEGRVDVIAKLVDLVKQHGIPSGVGAHDVNVIAACEKNNVNADFYIKTFHHHKYATAPQPHELTSPYSEIPGYWCRDPQEVIDLMDKVEKPWIAFKVMAAGAIPPPSAFAYAFANGADHVLAGMFDYEIAEDAGIVRDVLSELDRRRPWRS